MNSEFLSDAENEFREATRYYETEAPGVGVAFVTEVRRAIRWIIENPYAAVAVGSGIRSKMLNHFPYNILYAVERDLILIVAVAHQKEAAEVLEGKDQANQRTEGDRGTPMKICVSVLALIVRWRLCMQGARPTSHSTKPFYQTPL